MTPEHKALVGRLNAAGHDERLATGMLYFEAAAAIESLDKLQAEHEAERKAVVYKALEGRQAACLAAFNHHLKHGDMYNGVCLLAECAIHSPRLKDFVS